MITFPRTGSERCPNLLTNTGNSPRFDQRSRRSSCGLLHRHQLDEYSRFILPLIHHLLDASRLPLDSAQPVAQLAEYLLMHVSVPSMEDQVALPVRLSTLRRLESGDVQLVLHIAHPPDLIGQLLCSPLGLAGRD